MTYQLIEITNVDQAREEGDRLRHAIAHYFHLRQSQCLRFFSLRNEAGESVLSMSSTAEGNVNHIVGYSNKRPTEEQLAILQPLLELFGLQLDPSWRVEKHMTITPNDFRSSKSAEPQPVDPATMKLDNQDNVLDPGLVNTKRDNTDGPRDDEEYEEEVIFDAAMSLARMVVKYGKPLVIDATLYAELVSGVVAGMLDSKVWDLIGTPGLPADEKQIVLDSVIAARKVDRNHTERVRKFINDLSDAFTFDEVSSICPCVIGEYGLTDDYPQLGEANVIFIFKAPTPEEAFQVIL